MFFEEKEITIFTDLTDEEKSKFLETCREANVKKGEMVLEEGQMTRSLFVIKKGEVAVTLDINGIKYEIIKMADNDFFGEMSFLDGKMHSANVEATEDTTLYIIRKFSFDRFAKDNPEASRKIYENIIKNLLFRLRNSNKIIKELKEKVNEEDNNLQK